MSEQSFEQDLDEIFGPSGRGDYHIGQDITFIEDGKEYTGMVLHITAPSKTVRGRQLPTTYEVDTGDGWPHIVLPSQIIQKG